LFNVRTVPKKKRGGRKTEKGNSTFRAQKIIITKAVGRKRNKVNLSHGIASHKDVRSGGCMGDMRVIGGGTNGAGTGGAVVSLMDFLLFILPVAPPITKPAMSYSDSLQEFLHFSVPAYFQTYASPPVSSKSYFQIQLYEQPS
jgi:hypothetical protein